MSAPLRMGPCRRAQRPLRVRTQTHSTVMEAQQQNQIMHAVTPLVLSFALACLVAPVASQDVVAHAQQASEQLACKSKKHQQKVVAMRSNTRGHPQSSYHRMTHRLGRCQKCQRLTRF